MYYRKTIVLLATYDRTSENASPCRNIDKVFCIHKNGIWNGTWKSRVEQLVALLSALETLDSLVVHLLGHLLISQFLLLGFATVLDTLDIGLLFRSVMSSWDGKV